VTKKFLDYFDIFSVVLEQGCIAVPECMPANPLADTGFADGRFPVPPPERFRPQGLASFHALGIATIDEISTMDVKLAFDAARIARWPLFAFTVYLIIVYLLGAVADLTAATAKEWSLLASVDDTHARMITDQKARGAIIHERVAKAVKRMETLAQLDVERIARGKELEDQLA
jgi:hypothetical protein